jgi:hypothetical protein
VAHSAGAGGDFAALTATVNRLQQAIETVIEGKPEVCARR